ncbi:hypothetical protein JW711_04640 [Candidatus Woesearchaeota archaeon]|nr:hypothetical protein [Candidatus Woesearchaeota archaeon]
MKLLRLDFDHSMEKNGFSNFSYRFGFEGSSSEELKRNAKEGFGVLEEILDSALLGFGTQKEDVGNITSRNLSRGFKYCFPQGSPNYFWDDYICLKLNAETSGKAVTGIEVGLSHQEHDEDRLLRVYDRIIGLPGLELEPRVYDDAEKVKTLRSLDAKEAYQRILLGNS